MAIYIKGINGTSSGGIRFGVVAFSRNHSIGRSSGLASPTILDHLRGFPFQRSNITYINPYALSNKYDHSLTEGISDPRYYDKFKFSLDDVSSPQRAAELINNIRGGAIYSAFWTGGAIAATTLLGLSAGITAPLALLGAAVFTGWHMYENKMNRPLSTDFGAVLSGFSAKLDNPMFAGTNRGAVVAKMLNDLVKQRGASALNARLERDISLIKDENARNLFLSAMEQDIVPLDPRISTTLHAGKENDFSAACNVHRLETYLNTTIDSTLMNRRLYILGKYIDSNNCRVNDWKGLAEALNHTNAANVCKVLECMFDEDLTKLFEHYSIRNLEQSGVRLVHALKTYLNDKQVKRILAIDRKVTGQIF